MLHVFRVLIILAVGALVFGRALAQPDLKAYGALPFVIAVDISPSGEFFAAIVNSANGRVLLVQSLETGEQRLALGISEDKARGVSFFGNDHVVLRASITTRANFSRFDYEYSGAIAIDLDTGEHTQLLYRTSDLHPRQSGLGRMVARDAAGQTAYMPAYVGDTDAPSLDLFSNKIDATRGSRIAKGSRDTVDWFVGPDGEEIAREDFNGRSEVYEVFHYSRGRKETIFEVTDTAGIPISLMGLTPDGDGLYFIDSAQDGDAFETLFKLGFDGSVTETDFGSAGAEIDRVYLDNNRVVRGLQYSGALPSYRFFDPELQANADRLLETFSGGMVSILGWSDDHSKILYRHFDGAQVDHYGVWNVEDGPSTLARARNDIPPESVGSVMAIEYPARDGLKIPAILTLPPGTQATQENLPAIILPHGGPASYDRMDFDWLAQYFASRGYLVLQPNFRGSTGYGAAHRLAGQGEWGRAMQDDITDGVEALITDKFIDRDRICIVGASYGGYAALAGGAFTPDLYRCVISINGVSDVKEMLDQVRRESSSRTGRIAYWRRSISDGDTSRDRLASVSPAKHAEAFKAPVLLIHGRDDTVVPIRQSEIMNRALRRTDKDVELVKLSGEDHWLSNSETRIDTLEAIASFLQEHNPAD